MIHLGFLIYTDKHLSFQHVIRGINNVFPGENLSQAMNADALGGEISMFCSHRLQRILNQEIKTNVNSTSVKSHNTV